MTMVSYFASGFVYAKVANLVLFFRADPRLGLVYLILFILQGMLLPEPTYKGLKTSMDLLTLLTWHVMFKSSK
jgi:hypothetical protein